MTLELSLEELRLLASLASDQLFRREFIDPKMPGYKGDPAEVTSGKALVVRLKLMINQGLAAPAAAAGRAPGNFSKRPNGTAG
jgi:hypothetical protein